MHPRLRMPLLPLGLFGTLGLAQAAAPVPGTEPQDTLEEVIVTAQKRTEDVRRVPASISVISEADIAEAHLTAVADLARSVPNLSFSTQGGEGNQNIELRGISSTAGSSTVAVYLDDVPLTVRNLDTQGQVEPSFFDISRVEVLRGPQGTLYGASSEGGTIRYISNSVDLSETSGNLYADTSRTRHGGTNYTARGVLNTPIIPGQLGLRIGVSSSSTAGFVDHYSPDNPAQLLGHGVNGETTIAGRMQLEWKPNDMLDVRPNLIYQHTKSDDLSVLDLGSPDLLSQHKRVVEPGEDTLIVPSLTINYDLGGASFTSVTSYFYRHFDRHVDGTFYNSGYIGSLIDGAGILGLDGNPDGYLIGNVASPVHYQILTQQFSQEMRLASRPYAPGAFPLTWIAGAFYSNQNLDSRDYETAPGLNDTLTSVYGAGFPSSPAFIAALGGPATPVFPNDAVYLNNKLYGERQASVFGETTYYFTPALSATVGMRYLTARTSLNREGGLYFATGSPAAITVIGHGKPFTPKFALSYDLDPSTTTYATVSKGFRLGGPNRPLPSFCPSTPASYDADSLWNYEAGVKSRQLADKLSIAADVFYIDWKNIQVDINLPCTFDYYTNAGSAKSYGSELELRYKPSSRVTLAISGGYTHSTFSQNVVPLGITAGQDVPGVPRWGTKLSGRYNIPLGPDRTGFVAADWDYVSASHGTVGTGDPDYNRPAYGVLGMSGGTSYRDWRFSLFARNILNDQKIIQRPNLQTVNRGYTIMPRTLGVSAEVDF